MIEEYWNEVFGEFKEIDGKFNIPGFPEPLMSAHFGVRNIIGSVIPNASLSLKLCTFSPKLTEEASVVTIRPLREAISSKWFWDFHQNYNAGYEFSKRLMPFLVNLSNRHYHLYLKDKEGLIASSVIGVSKTSCFAFNLVVRPDQRGQGKGHFITEQTRSAFSDKGLFYWTTHPWFTLDGEVTDYYVL